MTYDPDVHHRRSIRLRDYDYARQGAYFVTICTQGRVCLFGEIVNSVVDLNEYGNIVAEEWTGSAEIRPEIELDAWVVMPNHLHGIVVIIEAADNNDPASRRGDPQVAPRRGPEATIRGPKSRSLGAILAGFKGASARRINHLRGTEGMQVWQRNYYEHVIRDDEDLQRIRQYIEGNPGRWAEDEENPERYDTG